MKNTKKILYISVVFNLILGAYIFIQYKHTSELSKTVASVENINITNNDILEHLQNNSKSRYSIVDEIVQQQLIDLEAKKLGLSASSEDIDQEKDYILNTDNLSDSEIKTRVLAKK